MQDDARTSLRSWPPSERPRERLLAHGPAGLTTAELLALILGSGSAEGNALVLCRRLLSRYDGLAGLARAGAGELQGLSGIGRARACALVALGELSRRLAADVARDRGASLTRSAEVYRWLLPRMSGLRQEVFYALALDARNRVRALVQVAQGTATSVEVHPREVFGPLVREGAAATILAHNHPSGDAEPSLEDERLTARLAEAGALLGIPVLDHLVIGDGVYVSLADRGLL